MTSHWPIIAVIIAVANAWILFWLKVYLDKRTKATAPPAKKEERGTTSVTANKRGDVGTWPLWWSAGATLSVTGCVVFIVIPGVTRLSVFFIFVFAVLLSVEVCGLMAIYMLNHIGVHVNRQLDDLEQKVDALSKK